MITEIRATSTAAKSRAAKEKRVVSSLGLRLGNSNSSCYEHSQDSSTMIVVRILAALVQVQIEAKASDHAKHVFRIMVFVFSSTVSYKTGMMESHDDRVRVRGLRLFLKL